MTIVSMKMSLISISRKRITSNNNHIYNQIYTRIDYNYDYNHDNNYDNDYKQSAFPSPTTPTSCPPLRTAN